LLPLGEFIFARTRFPDVFWLVPAEFHGGSYIAQFSTSAGILHADDTPYKPGLRAHLYFVLDRAATNAELKNWLHEYPVDLAVFSAVQPHYICDPILGEGVRCAVEKRLNLVRKDDETVSVPAQVLPHGGTQRLGCSNTNWVDPTDGPPTLDDLLTCEFVDWYLSRPHPEGERYEPTRAFAHNLRRVATEDWETLLEQLIPGDFPYLPLYGSDRRQRRGLAPDRLFAHLPARLPVSAVRPLERYLPHQPFGEDAVRTGTLDETRIEK
jgi:hypothetical protein